MTMDVNHPNLILVEGSATARCGSGGINGAVSICNWNGSGVWMKPPSLLQKTQSLW